MKRIILCLLIFSLTGLLPGYAQDEEFVSDVSKVGTTAASFLSIEVGARAIGMGGAFAAVANDATAMYWNPAGIAKLTQGEVTLNHADWLAETNFEYVGLVVPLGAIGTVGLNFTSLSMGDMEVRTVSYPDGTGEKFSASDISMGLSYARQLTDRFSIGFTGKYVQQKIWHMSASSMAVDIGTIFRTQFKDLMVGMSITNFGSKMQLSGKDTQIPVDVAPDAEGNNSKIVGNMKTDAWALPLNFRFGVAFNPIKNYNHRWTVAMDALHPSDNTEYVNLGTEYSFKEFVSLRAGYKGLFMNDNEEGLTLGAGLMVPMGGTKLAIDYAYADFGILDFVQRFTLSIRF